MMGCSGRSQPGGEVTASATSAEIASNLTQVVTYDNPELDDDLPRQVPVLVSYKKVQTGTNPTVTKIVPNVAFRIGCGSNFGAMLGGFGYFDVDLAQVRPFGSLPLLQEQLATEAGEPVPVRTLRCGSTPEETRGQLLQVYRSLDADPKKAQASYYMRLRDEPETLYTVSCASFLDAVGWTSPTKTIDQVTVPIDQVVLDAWSSQGIVQREVNCYKPNAGGRGATPLPAVNPNLPITSPRGPFSDLTQLYRVTDPFDGVPAATTLYLVSNGLGYAIDCGSNQGDVKAAFGFPVDRQVPALSTTDPVFVASHPGEQPVLRCQPGRTSIYETSDESPSTRYFRFENQTSLFQFTCGQSRSFFTSAAAPQGASVASAAIYPQIPSQSVPYLLIDGNEPNAPTTVHKVGCDPTARVMEWFRDTFGREANDTEVSTFTGRFYSKMTSLGSDATPERVAGLVIGDIEDYALTSDQIGGVIDRALESANPRPNTSVDADGNRLHDYIQDKIVKRYGDALRPRFKDIVAFVQERSPRLQAKMRQHLLASYGEIPTLDGDKAFDRGLMEKPDDAATYTAVQLRDNRAIAANASLLANVITRGVADGKKDNKLHPNLDTLKVFPEDPTFFKADVTTSGDTAFKVGIHAWIHERVAKSHAAPRTELVDTYNVVYGCLKTPGLYGPCPPGNGIQGWTNKFYDPANQSQSYSKAALSHSHQVYLTGCAAANSACLPQIDKLVSRACKKENKHCEAGTAVHTTWMNDVVAKIRTRVLYGNYDSVACFVRTNRNPASDPKQCKYTFPAPLVPVPHDSDSPLLSIPEDELPAGDRGASSVDDALGGEESSDTGDDSDISQSATGGSDQ
jgi:hypothetical protein